MNKEQTYLIKYLSKKNFHLEKDENYNELIFIYKKHYSELRVRLYFEYNYSSEIYTIRYYTNHGVKLRGRKTKATGSFGNRVYKNLQYIISKFESIAEEDRKVKDREKKYTTELRSYYEKIHKYVSINTYDSNYDNSITIYINGNDDNKRTSYNILYKNNQYFLKSKTVEYYEKN